MFAPIMKTMGCFSVIFSLTAGYIIVKFSTHQMGRYKWYLLNNVVSKNVFTSF